VAQKWIRVAMVSAFGLFAVALSVGPATSADEKLPDISTIMKKAHAKTDGYLAKVTAAAKEGKWDTAQATAKDLSIAAVALSKNKPGKGDEKSWEALTKKYNENAKAIADAAEKKDVKGVQAGVGAIQKSCGECHKAHKG
jgi:cytochrome c556